MKIKLKLSQIISLCFLGIALLPTVSHAQSASDPDYAKDDSCIASLEGGENLFNKSIKIKITASMAYAANEVIPITPPAGSNTEDLVAVLSGITGMLSPTLGADVLYAQGVVNGFVMRGPTANLMTNEDCAKHGTTIKFCYDPIVGPGAGLRWSNLSSGDFTSWSVLDDGSQNCSGLSYEIGAGEEDTYAPLTIFRGKVIADKLCVQIFAGYTGWMTMGCRWHTPPKIEAIRPECYVGKSCINGVHADSKSILPISSLVVACFRETMDNLFIDTSTCQVPDIQDGQFQREADGNVRYIAGSGTRTNLFHDFQEAIKKLVTLALTLYVIFFGIKIALGQQVPAKGELFIFILKMTLVVYFAIGDGLTDHIKPFFENLSLGLSQVFFTSGGSIGLCNYSDIVYTEGKEYLALFDALDCRVGYYLGFYNLTEADYTGTVKASTLLVMPAILTFFIPLLISMQIVMALATLMFGVLFLAIVVYVIHTYLVALIGLNIVLYLAPLMVPMALFKFTRGFFDGWIKILSTFAIQPIILFAFLALMITVFDKVYYNNCPFTSTTVDVEYPTKDEYGHNSDIKMQIASGVPLFFIDNDTIENWPTTVQKNACKDTMGYALFKMEKETYTLDLFIIKIRFPTELKHIELATRGIFPLLLFAFLFYFFAVSILGDLAGDLMGTFTVGSGQLTVGAKDMLNKLTEKAKPKKEKKAPQTKK